MNTDLVSLFSEYRQITGEPISAAILLALSFKTTEPVDNRPPLSVKEAAKELNVCEATVYQMCESGKLASHRAGRGRGVIRIQPNDLRRVQQAS